MKILKFDILNFKGVSRTSINVADGTPGNVNTLIGLNESGKTTILEAISNFVTEDKDTASLVETVHQKSSLQDIIPKDRTAAFTGRISIQATVELDDADILVLESNFLNEKSLILERAAIKRRFIVERVFEFEDSRHKQTHTFWSITFNLKTSRAKKFVNYGDKQSKDIWLFGINILRGLLPKVVYFPTFLFNFPDRICLEDVAENSEESPANAYYRQIIQDVLDSQGDGLDVQKHIIDRITRLREQSPSPAEFITALFRGDEKRHIDAVLQLASNQMSAVIFGAWNQILGRNVRDKRVQIDWVLDAERNNTPYLEVSIIDAQSRYSLSERSLGFRWFFSFLLFTQFRRNRKTNGSTIFLFDEPAANLHSRAQIKLLDSFTRIATDKTYIIYSTHSHYMVNPIWLEKAYIVENKAIDYDSDDEINSFAIRKTDISAIKYRTFVGSNPTKTTYFQPVLDALDVSFSPLERSSKALIVEGKYDYHSFIYLRRQLSGSIVPEIFPANGAGSIGNLISLFRGWGVKFRILLDDDHAGKIAKKKYMEEYLLLEHEVRTLGEISNKLVGKTFEAIYQDDLKAAAKIAFGVTSLNKKQYSLFFQELLAKKTDAHFPKTEEAFLPISNWVDGEFGETKKIKREAS